MKSVLESAVGLAFNFSQERGNRKMFHWIGTPCFIKDESETCDDRVTIVTCDGYVYFEIKSDDLESMDPGDVALFI